LLNVFELVYIEQPNLNIFAVHTRQKLYCDFIWAQQELHSSSNGHYVFRGRILLLNVLLTSIALKFI